LRLFYDFSGRKATSPKGNKAAKQQGRKATSRKATSRKATSRKATMPQGDKATKHPWFDCT
jgi:hypothetical protein